VREFAVAHRACFRETEGSVFFAHGLCTDCRFSAIIVKGAEVQQIKRARIRYYVDAVMFGWLAGTLRVQFERSGSSSNLCAADSTVSVVTIRLHYQFKLYSRDHAKSQLAAGHC
jgi:hypothetical protein